jgi:hypothetical protein
VETGHELTTEHNLVDIANQVSFNLLGTKEGLHSLLNLNFTINKLPMADLGDVDFNDQDDSASIADKIDQEDD